MKRKLSTILSATAAVVVLLVFFQNCARDAENSFAGEENMSSLHSSTIQNLTENSVRGQIIGHLDSVTYSNGIVYYNGWACKVGSDEQIKVHNGTIQTEPGKEPRFNTADQNSYSIANDYGENAIATQCQSSHGNHRFRIGEVSRFINDQIKTGSPAIEIAMWTYFKPNTNDAFAQRIVFSSQTRFTADKFCGPFNNYCSDANPPTIPTPAPTPAPTPNPGTTGTVIGVIDEVREDQGELLIRGWSCAVSLRRSRSRYSNHSGCCRY